MNFRKIIVFNFVFTIVATSNLLAEPSGQQDRNLIIENKLKCFSRHSTHEQVDWDEVCVNSSNEDGSVLGEESYESIMDESNQEISREQKVSRALDNFIKDHALEGNQQDSAQTLSDNPAEFSANAVQTISESVSGATTDRTSDQATPLFDKKRDSWWYDINESSTFKPDSFRSKPHTLDMSTVVVYYQYKEPGLMKLVGLWNGYHGKYSFRPAEGNPLNNSIVNVYSLEGIYASGNHNYHGGGQSGAVTYPITTKDIPGLMWEGRFLIGKDFYTSEISRVTPYVGLGVRQKSDKGGGRYTIIGSTMFLNYDRTATYFYVPFGITAELQDDRTLGLDVTFNLEYDYFLKGFTKTHNTDFDGFTSPSYGNEDINFHQMKGYGLRASMKILKRFPLVDLYVEPFLRYWDITESKAVYAQVLSSYGWWVEPDNNTFEYGSKFGARIGW